MLRLASDADVNGAIIRGLIRRSPAIDLVRAIDALPEGAPDPDILAWATGEGRVLISNDRKTMIKHVRRLTAAGKTVPGLIVTTKKQPIGSAIDDILCIAECMSEEEMRDQIVVFLPLQ